MDFLYRKYFLGLGSIDAAIKPRAHDSSGITDFVFVVWVAVACALTALVGVVFFIGVPGGRAGLTLLDVAMSFAPAHGLGFVAGEFLTGNRIRELLGRGLRVGWQDLRMHSAIGWLVVGGATALLYSTG